MELLQLKYFCEAAHTQNITKAAEKLCISQPSLSKTISRLEEQLGAPLFDRNGKRIALNDFGKCFLIHAERCLGELENGIKEVKEMAGYKEKTISVGTATARMLPNLIKTYLTENKNIKIKLFQVSQHSELLRQLEQGEIDISISSLPLKKRHML